jgi:hypothetical protein
VHAERRLPVQERDVHRHLHQRHRGDELRKTALPVGQPGADQPDDADQHEQRARARYCAARPQVAEHTEGEAGGRERRHPQAPGHRDVRRVLCLTGHPSHRTVYVAVAA